MNLAAGPLSPQRCGGEQAGRGGAERPACAHRAEIVTQCLVPRPVAPRASQGPPVSLRPCILAKGACKCGVRRFSARQFFQPSAIRSDPQLVTLKIVFKGPRIGNFSALSDSERSTARNFENLFQRAENWQLFSPQRLAAVLSP